MWGNSAQDIFAVGELGELIHFDGDSWQKEQSNTISTLMDVWGCEPGNDVAVGSDATILERREAAEATPQRSYSLAGVSGNPSDNMVAVSADAAILKYDGSSCRDLSSGTREGLNDMWGVDDAIYVVGENEIVPRIKGERREEMSMGADVEAIGIHGSDERNIFKVAVDNRIFFYGGEQWAE